MLFVCSLWNFVLRPQDLLNGMLCCVSSSSPYENYITEKVSLIATEKQSSIVPMGLNVTKIVALYFPCTEEKKLKEDQIFIYFLMYRLRHPCLTCGDDSNAQATWYQLGVWLVGVHAVVRLSPGHQTVHNFTKHPITTYTHHPENMLQHLTLDPLGQTVSLWKRLKAHKCHAVPPWSTLYLTTMSSQKDPINSEICSTEAIIALRCALLGLPCFCCWGAEGESSRPLSGKQTFSP